jgi:hypothetical protein
LKAPAGNSFCAFAWASQLFTEAAQLGDHLSRFKSAASFAVDTMPKDKKKLSRL